MRWGENWRLYLTPGDGLLISLLEEFLSKSVSFINDISLCSVRHLLSSQKGNYLFRPGNNISYCLSSRARREAKPRSREKQSRGFLSPDWRMPGSLIHLADSLSYAKRACVCECLHFSVCMSVCVCACVCGWRDLGRYSPSPAWNTQHWLIHSMSIQAPTMCKAFARALRGPWNEEGHPPL